MGPSFGPLHVPIRTTRQSTYTGQTAKRVWKKRFVSPSTIPSKALATNFASVSINLIRTNLHITSHIRQKGIQLNHNKHTALRLEWSEVGPIASKAIADIIGRSITCVGKRDDETYWEIQFVDYQMPLSEKFKILERIGVTKELQREYESTIATSLFMEASKKLLRYALKIEYAEEIISPRYLWLVGVEEKDEVHPLLLELGNLSLNFEELKSKQGLISYLMEHGPNHSSLMDFCEEYRDRYGNELCWSYPISDGKHLGTFIVLVKEGILSLPYDDADKVDYELFCMEDITFFDSDAISYFIDDWHLFDQDLLQVMYAIKHYLQKQEEQNEKQYWMDHTSLRQR